MSYKSSNLIKCLPALLLTFSMGAAAAGYDRDNELDDADRRSPTSISDLLPDVKDLNCQARCDGEPACGQLTTIDSCLEHSETHGCFWSCD
jgi:hypothetical protein